MKLNINKDIRKGLIFIFAITALLFSYLIYNEAYNPGFEEQKISVYNYSNKGLINYSVYLKPNNLYKNNKLAEGKLYITEFVDYLESNIKYEFTGDRANDVKANYSITAKVQGFTVESEKIINIWEKDFLVVPDKTINSFEDKISINERVKLNLNEYNTFVKEIKEASKINCQTVLTLSMNVNLNGSTEKGTFEESISPSLIIPLDVAMFEITGNNIDQPGAIEETIQAQLPLNKNLVIIFGIILAFLIIAIIILIFFTQAAPDKDPLEKELNKIFKKHGDRLVALNSDIDINKPIIVKSIDDLIKIADEAGKPILYKYSDNYKEIDKFCVTNNYEMFILELTHLDTTELVTDTEDTISENTAEQINIESQLNG